METDSGAAMMQQQQKQLLTMQVMVAIDDSDESFMALKWALDNLYGITGLEGGGMFMVVHLQEYFFPTVSGHARLQVKAETLVVEGDPKEMICELEEQMHIDLLVVGSRGLGKIKRAFLGSVSDYCAHQAVCPIAIVKPPKEQ